MFVGNVIPPSSGERILKSVKVFAKLPPSVAVVLFLGRDVHS